MKPYVYSEMYLKYLKGGWHQDGENVSYSSSPFGSSDDYTDVCPRFLKRKYFDNNQLIRRKRHFKMSFEFCFMFDNDTVSFALCVPYTYSDQLKFLKLLVESPENAKNCMY